MIQTTVAAGRAKPDLQKLQKATQDIEAGFVRQMLAAMRKASPEGGLGGQQYGGQMFKDMFDDALANAVTSRMGLGIAREISRHAAPEVIRQELQAMARETRK